MVLGALFALGVLKTVSGISVLSNKKLLRGFSRSKCSRDDEMCLNDIRTLSMITFFSSPFFFSSSFYLRTLNTRHGRRCFENSNLTLQCAPSTSDLTFCEKPEKIDNLCLRDPGDYDCRTVTRKFREPAP